MHLTYLEVVQVLQSNGFVETIVQKVEHGLHFVLNITCYSLQCYLDTHAHSR